VAFSGQARLLSEELATNSLIAGNSKGADPTVLLPDLSIDSAVDEDWFKITLDSDGQAGDFVRIRFVNELGNLAFELRTESNPTAVLFRSNGTSDTEQISLANVRKGTY
jgi:hypothetical protein